VYCTDREVNVAQRSEHYENRQESDTAATVPNITAEWRIGEVILDTYVVKQVHEGGGMGLVYRVHHRDWNVDLAVKSPRAKYFQTEQQKQNFARECETWINLGLHPHIVSCFYVRTLGDIPRVFAEYVEGGSLSDWIRCRRLYEGGPRTALKRILDISIQMAWGLHYAHEQGLIHQDVKPGNVLITPEGTAKITDFGLAKARASTAEAELTDQNRSILVTTGGMTPAYCSPEQASQQSLTRRTDIWSWGVSVLEMFVGDVMWRSGSAAPHVLEQLGELHLNEAVVPKMPDAMKRLLRQCFDVNPDKRPPSFSPVVEHLKQLYCEGLGEEFERAHPKAADLLADGLNNRAVSLLDLGKLGESEKILEQALLAYPGHPQATYNLGLIQWRNARKTDADLLAALRQVQQRHAHDPAALYFLGVVHLERGDAEGAILALREAKKIGGGADVDVALIEAIRTRVNAPRCVTVLETHNTSTNVVALSADARFALTLSGEWSQQLCLWDIPGGVCLHEFRTCGSYSLSVSADFRLALTSDRDRTVRLWDISTGACIKSFNTDLKGVGLAAMSADGGRALLGGSEDNRLKLLDLTTGNLLMILEEKQLGWRRGVWVIHLTRDGGMGFSAYSDGVLRLWDLNTGRCVQNFSGHWSVPCIAVSSDGRHLLSGGLDANLRLWSIEHDSCVATLSGHTGSVRSVAMAADGSWAISTSDDKTLRLWDLGTGRCLRTFEGYAFSVLNEDGRYVLSSDGGGTMRLWDLGPHPGIVGKIAAPPAICRVSGVTQVERRKSTFDRLMRSTKAAFAEGQYARCKELVLEARSVPGYEFARDALEWSNTVGRHGIRKRCRGSWCLGELEKLGGVTSLAMSLDGRLAVTGHRGYAIGIWDVPAQRLLKTVSTPLGVVKYGWAMGSLLRFRERLWDTHWCGWPVDIRHSQRSPSPVGGPGRAMRANPRGSQR
jgi:WD40 repeat protein/serine/threonine protein kinase